MHRLGVDPSAICIEGRLAYLATKASMARADRQPLVEMYERVIRSRGRVDVAPVRVTQLPNGYLHLVSHTNNRIAYIIACYRTNSPVQIESRKLLRPIGAARPDHERALPPSPGAGAKLSSGACALDVHAGAATARRAVTRGRTPSTLLNQPVSLAPKNSAARRVCVKHDCRPGE